MFQSRDECLFQLVNERLFADEMATPINDYIACLERLSRTDAAKDDGSARQIRAEALMYANLRDLTGAATPDEALDQLQFGRVNEALVKGWLEGGALNSAEQALAVYQGYPRLQDAAYFIISAAKDAADFEQED